MYELIDALGGDVIFAVLFFLVLFVGYRYYSYRTIYNKKDKDSTPSAKKENSVNAKDSN